MVKRSEWQRSSLGKLKVGGILDGKLEAISEVQRIRPSVGICLLVGRDVEQGEIRKRGAAKIRIDTASSNGHCQAVGDLKSPEGRHQRAIVGYGIKYAAYGLGDLVTVNPSERGGAIKDQEAHGRPSSRKAFHSDQSKAPSFNCSARSRMRRNAAWASARLKPGFAGTRRATSLPWRVMVKQARNCFLMTRAKGNETGLA
jgi:hypothetical protein